jgi:hypothetical protein
MVEKDAKAVQGKRRCTSVTLTSGEFFIHVHANSGVWNLCLLRIYLSKGKSISNHVFSIFHILAVT